MSSCSKKTSHKSDVQSDAQRDSSTDIFDQAYLHEVKSEDIPIPLGYKVLQEAALMSGVDDKLQQAAAQSYYYSGQMTLHEVHNF